MTIDHLYKNYIKSLTKIYDEREAVNITNWVLESIAQIKRSDIFINKEKQLDDLVKEKLDDALEQLLKHKPVQYVLQETWFYKMKFYVDEHVLIPRPETEELVEWVVENVRSAKYEVRSSEFTNIVHQTSDVVNILDIGTGSGCIAISLKKELPNAVVFAIDVSEEALKVAEKNAKAQGVNIEFIKTDFLNEESIARFTSSVSGSSFDVITSNPPYIPEKEKNKIDKNVIEHEPHLALFVANGDPFIFYKKIAVFAQNNLNKNGKIFVEVHEDYSNEVLQIFTDHNFKTENKKDIYGRQRMICARR